MEGDNADAQEDQKVQMEDQFVLRLPPKQAEKVRKILREKPKKLKKTMAIDLDVETGQGSVVVGKKQLKGQLVNLPTIVDSNKCIDKVQLFKTANITQMLICSNDESSISKEKLDCVSKRNVGHKSENKCPNYPHGLTPPMKNVRRTRFRKKQINRNEIHESDVEKEVLWLLRMDNAAVASRFEFIDAEPDKSLEEKERHIFGEIISDSSSESTSDHNEIIDYTH